MGIEEKEITKIYYKLLIISVKYIPILVGIGDLVTNVLSYFDIETSFLSIFFGSSVSLIVPLYVSSYALQFCKYHRTIINYIVCNKVIFLIDYCFKFPYSDLEFLWFNLVIAGIYLILTIYNYKKYGYRRYS